jgi:hypothetical protein
MMRKLIAYGLLGSLLLGAAVGCSDRKGAAEIPTREIPLPKDGLVAGGGGAKKAAQAGPKTSMAEK